MRRKIPYTVWSTQCATFSTSRRIIPHGMLTRQQLFSLDDQEFEESEEKEIDPISGRIHSLKVMLPRQLNTHSESDLKLMLVSLKNAMVTGTVHISRIEKELRKRGINPSILSGSNEIVPDYYD